MNSQWGRGVGKALMLRIIYTPLHLTCSIFSESTLCLLSRASILAKTCLYLDQERRKSHHTLNRQPFAQSLLMTSPLLSKKAFVFHICPNTLPFTLPTYLSKSSGYLFSSSCHLFFLLLAEQVTNLCPFLLMASQACFDVSGGSYDFWTTPEYYRHWSDTSEVSLSSPWKVAHLRLQCHIQAVWIPSKYFGHSISY